MNIDLAYLAGYIDGDGCFYIGKNISPVKYRNGIIISSTDKEVLRLFCKRFGGCCVFDKKNPRFKTYNPINQWIIGGTKGNTLANELLLYLLEKRTDAQFFINFFRERDKFIKDSLISQIREHRKTQNLVTLDKIEEINNISKTVVPSQEDLAYLAGFIDSECSFNINKYKPKNRPNKTYKILLQCNNTKTNVMFWLMARFGGCCYFVPRKRKNPLHKDQVAWRVSAKALFELLPKVRPYLKHKQPICDKLIEFYETTLLNGGDRQSKDFKKSYDQIIQRREAIANKIHILNSKFPI